MNFQTGRPDHIEDYLITVKTGQWFGWSESSNKIYANLIVHDGVQNQLKKNVQMDLLHYKLHGI